MNTAVQLQRGANGAAKTDLVYGTPAAVVAGKLGPVALSSPGELVAYRIRHGRRTRLFVFRTMDVEDRLAASIPWVRPRVQLLLDLRSAGRARLVRGLFGYLIKNRRDPHGLPDAFYVRVGVALGGRLPAHKILPSLLGHSDVSQVVTARSDPYGLPREQHGVTP